MARTNDQNKAAFELLMSAINNSNTKVEVNYETALDLLISGIRSSKTQLDVDYGKVKEELGLVSRSAARARYNRLANKHGLRARYENSVEDVLNEDVLGGIDTANGVAVVAKDASAVKKRVSSARKGAKSAKKRVSGARKGSNSAKKAATASKKRRMVEKRRARARAVDIQSENPVERPEALYKKVVVDAGMEIEDESDASSAVTIPFRPSTTWY